MKLIKQRGEFKQVFIRTRIPVPKFNTSSILKCGFTCLKSSMSKNCLISGDMWQLPPIYDQIVLDKNHLDG